MKLDKRKKYIMVLDVETTNNDMTSKFNDGLVYDIGFGIYDLKGNAYCERSYCIKEIFEDKSLMNSAYYKEKLPKYYEEVYDFKEEVAKDIDKLIEKISYYQTPNGINELFNLLPLKKNNKLNKTKKPILHTLDYGYYIEDCYGWKTQQLRLAAKNELEAEVYLDSTIIHY